MCLLQKLVDFNFLNATRYLPVNCTVGRAAALCDAALDGTVTIPASIFPLKN